MSFSCGLLYVDANLHVLFLMPAVKMQTVWAGDCNVSRWFCCSEGVNEPAVDRDMWNVC